MIGGGACAAFEIRPTAQRLYTLPRLDLNRAWLDWLQQVQSLIYLVAGIFLLYQNWKRFHRQSVFLTGIMFIAYSVYRFFLVRRWIRRRTMTEGK